MKDIRINITRKIRHPKVILVAKEKEEKEGYVCMYVCMYVCIHIYFFSSCMKRHYLKAVKSYLNFETGIYTIDSKQNLL